MKIAIITFWWSNDNYGQLIQAFSLVDYLVTQGHSVTIIKYKPEKKINFGYSIKVMINNCFKYFAKFRLSKVSGVSINNQYNNESIVVKLRDFENFRKSHMNFTNISYKNYSDLKRKCLNFDAYICGSDKIWSSIQGSFRKVYRNLDSFSLAFIKNKNAIKVSYAPSIGSNNYQIKAMRRLISNLSSFQGVSLRESSSVELIQRLGIRNVTWVPDPTQLIGAEGYFRFIDSNITKYQRTWFIYGLNNPSYITSNQIAKEIQRKGIDFGYTGANGNYDDLINCYPSIPEWISYIYYAKNVITNSYHGCIFCILFHKNFYYIPVLPDKDGFSDERVLSIMNLYEIKNRALHSIDELKQIINQPYKPIDWDFVDAKREEFVKVGKDFLAKNLGDSI